MKEYFKEKLKVDLDLYKLYITINLVLIGGLASLALKDKFGDKRVDIFLFVLGCVFLLVLIAICVKKIINVNKDLDELKNI